MFNFEEVLIEEIVDFPSANSGITQKFIYAHKGNIPVYGSRKDGKPIGYIENNLPKIKYYSNCLGYNRNGSVGNTFFHDHKFCSTEDHRAMIVKSKYKNQIDYNYLAYKIEESIFNNGYNWNDKAGKEKVKNLSIEIPIDNNNKFDLQKQKEIYEKNHRTKVIKSKLNEYKEILSTSEYSMLSLDKVKLVDITELFEIHKGSSKYTQKYINNNKGEYPVYSSKTTEEGVIGYIDSYDWDLQEAITWTTDGVYAGTSFLRTGKFNISGHAGILVPKPIFYQNNFNLGYINCILKPILLSNAEGVDGQNKRVTVNIIKKIQLPIPVDNKKLYDLNKQKELAEKYNQIIEEKNRVLEKIEKLIDADVSYIVC